MTLETLQPAQFRVPAVLLSGSMDESMYTSFRGQLDRAPAEGVCVVELSTLGGDPDVARMMGEDIRFHSQHEPQRRFVFLGKAVIYSAGTTFMSFFPRVNRYLTPGTRLMIHERLMTTTLQLNGPLSTCLASVQAMLNQLNESIVIQNEGFENLVRGSGVSIDEVQRRAPANWYVEASKAVELGLIEAVI